MKRNKNTILSVGEINLLLEVLDYSIGSNYFSGSKKVRMIKLVEKLNENRTN